MQKGLKIRLYPNKKQMNILSINFGHTRFVYNYFLDYSKNNNDYNVSTKDDPIT